MHLFAWFESATNPTLAAIAALADTSAIPEGTDGYQVPDATPHLMAGAALGTSLIRARPIAPSLEERRSTQDIYPLSDSAETFALTHPQIWVPNRSIPLAAGEVLTFHTAQDSGGAAVTYGLAFLKGAGELPAMPPGQIIQARATGTTTLTIDVWNTVPLTLDQELPVGRYAVVGFIPMGATVIAARLLIPGNANRPGMPGLIGAGESVSLNAEFSTVNKLMYYNMGEFPSTALPQMEYLATTGDTAQTVYFLLVKVA